MINPYTIKTKLLKQHHNLHLYLYVYILNIYGSAGKESTCNSGDTGDVGSIPGLGRSPGEGNGNYSNILAWKTPWTEESGDLQSLGSQRARRD